MTYDDYLQQLIDTIDRHTPPLPKEEVSPQEQEMNRLKERVTNNNIITTNLKVSRERERHGKEANSRGKEKAHFNVNAKIIYVDFTKTKK